VRLPGWLVAVGLAALLLWTWQRAERRVGALDQQVRARETVIAALAVQKARVDTVRMKSRAAAFDSAAAYQKLRDSLLAMLPAPVDSVPTEGTVVPTLIRAADAAIASCHRALSDCGNAISVRDSTIAQLDTLVRDLRRQRRGCRLLGLLPCPRVSAGLNVDPSGARPGVHLGIPLF
jgi:hypothetical protein